MKRKSSLYIKDIIDAITKIEEFVENYHGVDYEVVWRIIREEGLLEGGK